jgi:hypothetical protein
MTVDEKAKQNISSVRDKLKKNNGYIQRQNIIRIHLTNKSAQFLNGRGKRLHIEFMTFYLIK